MTDDSIPYIPEMPLELRDAIDRGRLILFIGAGVSQAAGFPSWNQLAINLIEEALGDDHYAELNVIKSKRFESKHLMSLAREYHDNDESFRNMVCNELDCPPTKEGEVLIRIIKSWDASIITTNYDLNVERIGAEYDSYHHISKDEPNLNNLNKKRFILHIHGSIKEPENMVLTEIDYYNLYYSPKNRTRISRVMRTIFGDQNNVILFIGSGLSEQEILQFMIPYEEQPRFFNLMGFLSNEIHLKNHMCRLYRSMNINLIPYCMDRKGYGQLIEVIMAWDDVVKNETLRTSHTVTEMRDIISSECTPESSNRLKQFFVSDDSNIINFCLMLGGDYSKEWCIMLMEYFVGDRFIESVKKKSDFLRIFVYTIYRIFEFQNEFDFRKKVKLYCLDIVDILSEDDQRRSIMSNICDIEISCPIIQDERIQEIVKESFAADYEAYHIETILSGDIDSYNSSDRADLAWFVQMLITAILSSKDKEGSDDYRHINIDSEFTQGFFFNLRPDIFNTLFQPLYEIFLKNSENYLFASELGSVSEMESRDDLDADIHICLWLSMTMRNVDPSVLEDIVSFIESDHNARSIMALNAINHHWKDLGSKLLELNDFDNVNYSELYDLLLRNRDQFTDDEKEKLSELVNKSVFKMNDEQAIRVFREDLIIALNNEKPGKMPELEGLPYPKDRGKIINCWVSTFVRDDEQPFDFDDFKSIIYSGKATEHPDHNPIDLVENYLNRHGDEVIERIDTLEVDKLSMKLMIVRYISNKTIFKTKIFDFFESLIQYDMEQCQLEYDLLRYFEIWNRINTGYEEESAKIYREIIEKMIDHVISSNYEGNYYDWFVACFSNWYFLSMADYIKFCKKDGIDKELVCSLLVRIMESPNNYASSFSLVFGIVYYWSLSDNEGLSVRIRDRIKSDPNCLDIVESCLKYNNLHSTIIRWINEDELFESIINDKREDNRNLDDALHRLGFHTALLYEREGAYLLNIDRGIVCGKYAFLRGIIQFVLYSMKKEEDPSRTIDLLSKAELDEGMHVTSADMLHLFEETQSFDSRLLIFMIKLYRCNISFVWKKDWKFIQSVYAKDPVQALEMMTALAENTKISFHDEDSLYRLVETMVSDYKTDARIRKIINGLIRNQRLVRYSDFLD